MHRLAQASSILAVVAACQSSSNSSSTSESANARDASLPDGAAPALSRDACLAIIAYTQRCADSNEGRSDACAAARQAQCDAMTAQFSVAYHDAVVACFTATVQCGDTDQCVGNKLSQTNPSAAMLKVRDDYCATCGAEAGPDCANAFYKISDDGYGDGVMLLQMSDALVADIDSKCTGSALDIAGSGATNCRDAFGYCAANEADNALPPVPDECNPPAPPDDEEDAGAPEAGPSDAGADDGG
jgi:hypothetical protein